MTREEQIGEMLKEASRQAASFKFSPGFLENLEREYGDAFEASGTAPESIEENLTRHAIGQMTEPRET